MAASSSLAFHVHGFVNRPSIPTDFDHLKKSVSSTIKPFLKELKQLPMRIGVSEVLKRTSGRILDAFVDSVFRFVDQPTLPFQSNFEPVEEIGQAVTVSCIEGEIPFDFPEGIYIRNGPNPLFGALKSTVSVFGRSSQTWIEGEGMVHSVYFTKGTQGNWTISYKNKYVETETFKIEKERNKPSFLPAIEGDSPAIIAAYFLNQLRFGKVNRYLSNTNIFEHSGKVYSIAENHIAQEIDILNLKTLDNWDINGCWDRPFTSHPKRTPGTGELVIMGIDATDPYFVLGIVSADGAKLSHKVDLKFKRRTLCHEIGITEKYNVIMDYPLTLDINRLYKGGPLIKYEKEGYTRIGVMPRYGDEYSVKWFDVEPHCTFHLLNCFDDGDEIIVRGCQARGSIIPGPDFGLNKFEWFSRGFKPIFTSEKDVDDLTEDGMFFCRLCEWRLNMETGEVKENYLTGTDFSMDFPFVNSNFIGLKNKYGYAQVVDSIASSNCGLAKYGRLAKLHLEGQENEISEKKGHGGVIKVEYHTFDENQFCSRATFVSRNGSDEEDDGWIISFVHHEHTSISEVHIIDVKNFASEPVAKIALPQRVPYGFHSTYISK